MTLALVAYCSVFVGWDDDGAPDQRNIPSLTIDDNHNFVHRI